MLKKYTNKHLFTALLLSVLPLQYVQADVIYFDIEATQRYENVHEFTVDGQYIPSYNYSNIDPQQFQSSINFNLFSPENISLTAMEHEFEDNGNTLAWWMTVFNFDPQSIFSPFEDELLGMIDQGAYDNIDLQHLIFAAGKYHYFNPQDDSDVVEELIFRKEMFGYSMYDTVDGSYQNSFSYWQQFTITLPSPMSFDNRNLFDSALTDTMLQQYSGFGVAFDTFISIQEFWNNPDFTQSSSKSTQTGYAGYGNYSFTSSQAVPAPATISLFVPFLLAGLVAVRRRIVAR